jgi:hypothetical protein
MNLKIRDKLINSGFKRNEGVMYQNWFMVEGFKGFYFIPTLNNCKPGQLKPHQQSE